MRCFASAFFLAVQAFSVTAVSGQVDDMANWRAWRGPLVTGVAPQANPPQTWDENTNIKWKVPLPGRGSGSPIVDGDRIYLLTAIKTDRTVESQEVTLGDRPSPFRLVQTQTENNETQPERRPRGERGPGERRGGERRRRGGRRRAAKPTNFYKFDIVCIDRTTGNILWQKTAAEVVPHEAHHGTASFASSTPITDGENLYVSFGSRGVYSYDLEGNQRWKYEVPPLYMRNSFGEGASPALYGDTLIVNCDHEQQSFIVALDANTGQEKWKQLRDEETSWDTPLIIERDGTVQVIVNAMNKSRAYDLANGEVIWECGGQASGPVPTPIVHEDLVFCMTGHRGAALNAIPLDSRGDISDSDTIAWKLERDTPYVPSPLLYDDLLYFTKSNNAILTCVKAPTGEVQFRAKRLPDMDAVYASPVAAAGRIYISGRNGMTIVLKHGSEFEVLAQNQLDETIDATPALVGDQIIIRGEQHLYCIAKD